MRDESIQKAPGLALRPAMFLCFGEFFLQVLLRFFIGFFVVVVVRCEEGRMLALMGMWNCGRGEILQVEENTERGLDRAGAVSGVPRMVVAFGKGRGRGGVGFVGAWVIEA